MLEYTLSPEQLDELRAAHRGTQDKREADYLKAAVALATGWTAEEVTEILQVAANTVRNHFKRYRADSLAGSNRVGNGVGGSPCLLTEEQLIALDIHLQANLYLSAKAITHWVEETFGVSDLDIVIEKIQDNSRKYLHFWEQDFDPIAFDCLYSAFYAPPITNANQHLKYYTVFNELPLQSLLESVGFKHVKRFRCKTMDENHGFDDGMLSPSSLNMICTK